MLKYLPRGPISFRRYSTARPRNSSRRLPSSVQVQTALNGVGIYDISGTQLSSSLTGAANIGQSFINRNWFQGVIATGQPYLGTPTLAQSFLVDAITDKKVVAMWRRKEQREWFVIESFLPLERADFTCATHPQRSIRRNSGGGFRMHSGSLSGSIASSGSTHSLCSGWCGDADWGTIQENVTSHFVTLKPSLYNRPDRL